MAQEGRGIALLFLDLGVRKGWVVSTTPRPLYPGKVPVPIVQEAGWAPGPVLTGAENLATTGIRSLDRPVRSQSLYRLANPPPPQFTLVNFYFLMLLSVLFRCFFFKNYVHILSFYFQSNV
jgi:hypothetical protein